MASSALKSLAAPGFFLAPLAWALNTQTNYSLVAADCANHHWTVVLVSAGLAVLALCGGGLSLAAWRRDAGAVNRFVSAIGGTMALLLTVVILTQGAAALILAGCEK